MRLRKNGRGNPALPSALSVGSSQEPSRPLTCTLPSCRGGWIRTCPHLRNGLSTASELRSGGAGVTSITADLSLMSDVRRACGEFRSMHDRLDVLILNANAIAQSRTLTDDGHERNFALGFLSRALMAMELQSLCAATPGSQMLTVVGLNLARVNFDDLTMTTGFSGQKALGAWQWAMQVCAREFNARQPVPMNIFRPGSCEPRSSMTNPAACNA